MVEQALIFYRKFLKRKPYGWSGDFPNWNAAAQQCTGYDANEILEKVKNAVLKVKSGEAAFEKDSVLFGKPEYSYPLLTAVLWVALQYNNRLSVLDFGGSLGSTYFQNKKFFDSIKQLEWNIVEQPNFVETGNKYFSDHRLKFYSDAGEPNVSSSPQLLIIACAIQYMQDPYALIDKLITYKIPYVLIDNTPFNYEARDRISIQKVPPSIYNASYPCWFLNYDSVLQRFDKFYELVSEHHNDDIIELDGRKIPYRGFLLKLKNYSHEDH